MVRTVASATGAGEVEVLLLDPVLPHSKVRPRPFIDLGCGVSDTKAGRPAELEALMDRFLFPESIKARFGELRDATHKAHVALQR